MKYGCDVSYRIAGTRLSVAWARAGAGASSSRISEALIRTRVAARYADLLDAWAVIDGMTGPVELARGLAYRGDVLQWNGYLAAWWYVALELIAERSGVALADLSGVRAESREIPQYLLSCLLRLAPLPVTVPIRRPPLLPVVGLGFILATGFVVGAAEYLAAWIVSFRPGRRLECRGDVLVLVYASDENTTKHVYRWLRDVPPERYTPYLLGSPLRAWHERKEWAASSLPTIGEFFRGTVLGVREFFAYLGVARRSAAPALCGGAASWRRLVANGSRLARTGIHRARLLRAASLPPTALFCLQGAEGLLLDPPLQSAGVRSVHWLHGILASRRNLDGISSLAIAKSNADVAELQRHGHYAKVVNGLRNRAIPRTPLAETQTGADILLLTSIYHPTRVPPPDVMYQELKEYLELTVAFARATGRRLIWRPHPREVASNCIETLKRDLDLNNVVIDFTSPLKQQIDSAGQILTMVSATILDVMERGRVPAIYTGAFSEPVGLALALPAELCFADLAGARAVHALLDTAAGRQRMLDHLQTRLVFDRDYAPAGTSFADLAGA